MTTHDALDDTGESYINNPEEAFRRCPYDKLIVLNQDHLPIFVSSAYTKHPGFILIPDPDVAELTYPTKYPDDTLNKVSWKKKKNKIFWRGSCSGGIFVSNNWFLYPRSKLVLLSKRFPEILDAKFVSHGQVEDNDLVDRFHKLGFFAGFASLKEQVSYKYLVVPPGNTVAWSRMYWTLRSNSVVMLPEYNQMEWYFKGLQPWVHFIPLKEDMSDIHEKYDWAIHNDHKAKQISEQATQFTEEVFSEESLLRYFKELLDQYAKLCCRPQ